MSGTFGVAAARTPARRLESFGRPGRAMGVVRVMDASTAPGAAGEAKPYVIVIGNE